VRRFAFVILILLSVPVFCQSKRPFTFEDMMKLKRVGEPVPSPDSKWVLFAAVDIDLAANKKTSHIWIVPLAGGQERVLIADQDGDRPRWAPDGKHFAFISNKEGGAQVWLADFDVASGATTGVHKLTSIATKAGGELWSPDGKNILFTSNVYPECDGAPEAETACNAKRVKEVDESMVKALIFDRLFYRHWNSYKGGMRAHLLIVPVDGSAAAPRDLTPGDYDAPVFSLGGQDNYAFSPDGQEICYTSNHDKVEATSTNNDLWIVPVNAGTDGARGAPKNITADNPASDSTPLYSPDGKYIAYRAQQRPGYESDRFDLMLYDRKTGKKRNLTGDEDFDHWVGGIAWASDSSQIFFAAEEEGSQPIFVFDLRPHNFPRQGFSQCEQCTDVIHKLPTSGWAYRDDIAVAKDGSIWFTVMTATTPTSISRFAPGKVCGFHDKQGNSGCILMPFLPQPAVESLNKDILSQIAMSPLESFWFTGAFGDKVQGFLVKPPNFDASKKYPLKFIIHGGPEVPMGDEWSYRWNAELFAASGYVVIMINFHGSPGYGQKFIDEINGDWGGAPFEDLMKGLDYAEKTYPFIDKDRECALGASYGGYMANWVLGHTNRFKCIVSHDGMFNTVSAWGTTEELWFPSWEFKGTPYTNPEMYEKWNPRNYGKNFKTPTLVVHGQLDYRLDVSEGFQLFDTLQMMGVPSKMLYFPDEGHWVLKPQNSQLWYKTVNDWVDQWTKK
jgi:dipeptidyl aminopeptidase/acylaminoacyl peptidase